MIEPTDFRVVFPGGEKAAGRARRQYQLAEPENRLVIRQLETDWETALADAGRLEADYQRFTEELPKTLTTGMINGIGGKFRLVTIPKETSKDMPISIGIQGNGTLKKNIFSTTLPADFAASPQPCFKVTGTLFDAAGGKCNQ